MELDKLTVKISVVLDELKELKDEVRKQEILMLLMDVHKTLHEVKQQNDQILDRIAPQRPSPFFPR